jgi:two-component system KDP operon response regulator KdpE
VRRTSGVARLLVVDDDAAIRRALVAELAAAGYEVLEARDGAEGIRAFRGCEPDLVLTDLAMPVADGFDLVRRVRSEGATPIVVLSVRGSEADKIRALDLGADDYVVKPFSAAELLARVRAQLRRSAHEAPGSVLRFPGLVIDRERRQVLVEGRDVRLTPTEFAILVHLALEAGKPVTIRQIIGRVWGGSPGTSPDVVRVHVGSLRRKVEPNPAMPRYIVTEPWVGYRFVVEPVPP